MAKKASSKRADKPPYHVLADQHNALIAADKHDEAAKFHRENIANYNGPVSEETDEELKKLEVAVDAAKARALQVGPADETAAAELAAAEKALADYTAE